MIDNGYSVRPASPDVTNSSMAEHQTCNLKIRGSTPGTVVRILSLHTKLNTILSPAHLSFHPTVA